MDPIDELSDMLASPSLDKQAFRDFVTRQGGPNATLSGFPLVKLTVLHDSFAATKVLLDMGADIKDEKNNILLANIFITSSEIKANTMQDAAVTLAAQQFNGPLTDDFWSSQGENGFSFQDTAGLSELRVKPLSGEGLDHIADRFNEIMGDKVSIPQAMSIIAAANGFTVEDLESGKRVLTTEDTLIIPLGSDYRAAKLSLFSDNLQQILRIPRFGNLQEIAEHYRAGIGFPDDTAAALRAIAQVNGIEVSLAQDYAVKPSTEDPSGRHSYFIIPLLNDFRTINALPKTPLHGHNPTDLIVMEKFFLSLNTSHHEDTTRVAQGVGEALDSNATGGSVWAFSEQFQSGKSEELEVPDDDMNTAIRLLMRTDEAARGNIVFSYSMGAHYDSAAEEKKQFQNRDTPSGYLASHAFWNERLDPIIFVAAGNDYREGRVYQETEVEFHGNRQMRVGAIGNYSNYSEAIASYSNAGADLCAPMTHDLGEQYHGTSFAAPYLAGSYRVHSERYGQSEMLPEGLTYDEFMATAMMSARRNIFERDERDGDTRAYPVRFTVNGGSIPYHDRCGAGLVDNTAWDNANAELLAIKQEHGLSTNLTETFVSAGTPHKSLTDNRYTYQLRVPENMTLGRLTLHLPQAAGEKGAVIMITPSGDSAVIQQSEDGLASTRRFIMEDVRAGDLITLQTEKPLLADAGLFLRGYAEDSAIAFLRDKMIEQGRLPEALQNNYESVIAPNEVPTELPAPSHVLQRSISQLRQH